MSKTSNTKEAARAFIKENWLLDGVSFVLSIVAFFLIEATHFLAAHSEVIGIVCLVVFIVSGYLRKKRRLFRLLCIGSFVCLVLCVWYKRTDYNIEKKQTDLELIADATYAGITFFDGRYFQENVKRFDWFIPASLNDEMLYLLVPSNISLDRLGSNAFDPEKIYADSPEGFMRMYTPELTIDGKTVPQGKYVFAGLYKPHLKENHSFKRCIILPSSVAITIQGLSAWGTGDFKKAREYLEKADSLDNAVAASWLAKVYFRGLGVPKDLEKATKMQERAAALGSRRARMLEGETALADPESSALKKALAEDYLKKAATVQSIVSPDIVASSEKACYILCTYYWVTKRYKDAYRFTKSFLESFNDPNVRYYEHLYNCIYCDKMKEAEAIVAEGEKEGAALAFVVHAEMLRKGKGFKRDFIEAERLLRYVTDSLKKDPSVYNYLAELYNDAADTSGSYFWKRLADIKFKTQVNDE